MMKTRRRISRAAAVLLAAGGLLAAAGCASGGQRAADVDLQQRILPPSASASADPSAPQAVPSHNTAVAPSGPLTLHDAITVALANNHTLKISNEDANIAEQQVRIARSLFLPQVSAGYGYDVRDREVSERFGAQTFPFAEKEFQHAELKLQMTIWDFGQSLGKYRQAQLGREIARLQLRRIRQGVIYRTTKAYFGILRARKAEAIATEALAQAKAHLETAQNLHENGVVDKNDVLRAEVRVAEVRQDLISAGNAVKLATSVFNSVLGINVNTPTKIADMTTVPEFKMNLLLALQTAVDCRSEFLLVRKSILAEKAGLAAAQGQRFPRIYVTAQANRMDDDYQTHKNSALGEIGIQMDLFTGGRMAAQTRVAERRIRKAVETAEQVCDTISLEVKQGFLGVEDARERLAVAKTAVSQADENLRLVENKYKQAVATPTDVVDAETLKSRAQENYFTAFYDHFVAIERLRYAMGTIDISRPDVSIQPQPGAGAKETTPPTKEKD